jgi:hypothetical protein
MLPVGLAVVCVFLFVVLFSSGKKTSAPSSVFSTERSSEPRLTAREEDRNVQAKLVAEYYAEAVDERFKQQTLADMATLLAARKS